MILVLNDLKALSMAFLVNLVVHVYAVAASGTGIETLGGLERLANFSLRWDPVGDIVILWRSTSDPTIGFLVFRGMLSAYEWGIDFMYYQVPYEFAVAESGAATPMIHSGFFKAYSSIGASIRRAIVSNGISQLFITGHSLGGALSILAASDLSGLSASGPSAIASAVDVTTFGAPRVGNQAFAAQIHSSRIARILQVRSEDDIVPTTPLSSMVDPARPLGSSLSYEHVGEFVYFRRPQPTIAASHALDNYIGFAMDQ